MIKNFNYRKKNKIKIYKKIYLHYLPVLAYITIPISLGTSNLINLKNYIPKLYFTKLSINITCRVVDSNGIIVTFSSQLYCDYYCYQLDGEPLPSVYTTSNSVYHYHVPRVRTIITSLYEYHCRIQLCIPLSYPTEKTINMSHCECYYHVLLCIPSS